METINKENIITETQLVDLPRPVQRYLTYTGVIGKPWINTVQVKYRGAFRLGADKPWMPMRAEQVYTVNPPGFQWQAHIKMFGLPLMYGQDTYKDGAGHMFGKLGGLFTIFDACGPELLQGTMVRYLQEMMWFPTAYLSDDISWQAIGDHCADVTFNDGEQQVTGWMYFDDVGRLLNFVADRYREHQGEYVLMPWSTPITEYGTLAGLQLPTAGSGVWQLPEGDLSYIRLHVTDLNYNVPIPAF